MIKRIEPLEGQESVWDYPRPPRLEKTTRHLRVLFNGIIIAETSNAYRLLETSHPPSYYFPVEDVKHEYLSKTNRSSYCEFKGRASYYTVKVKDKVAENAAWFYENPSAAYTDIKGFISFYASRMDACFVDEELVTPQAGDFYGGWITRDIVGPFKGGIGTMGW